MSQNGDGAGREIHGSYCDHDHGYHRCGGVTHGFFGRDGDDRVARECLGRNSGAHDHENSAVRGARNRADGGVRGHDCTGVRGAHGHVCGDHGDRAHG